MGNKQSMNALQVFEFQNISTIRVDEINGAPYFCLTDVCRTLGINNPSCVTERLNQKGVVLNYTLTKGGKQRLLFINEGNLYKVIFKSDKPQARDFEDWVTSEVLPAIRKTGNYGMLPQPSVTEQDYRDLKMLYDMEKRMRELFQKESHYYMDLCNDRTDRLIERSDMLVKVITGTM